MKQKGYTVRYVRNFTDIDDKIIARSQKEGVSWKQISETYIASFSEDMKALGVLSPTLEPRASEHIDGMIHLISQLVEKGMAYAADGDVFFDVHQFSAYGKLSGKDLESLQSGARVEIHEAKKNPLDFALWKKMKPGEPFWDSPWGPGRPGWHIECSVMAMKLLGERLDIHGGGRDLIFPHHENEIAQSEAATGEIFAKCWMHNGIIHIGKEKMSKSLGNALSIKAMLERFDFEVIRLFVLSAHYRSPLDYSEKALGDARSSLTRFYETLRRLGSATFTRASDPLLAEKIEALRPRYTEAMDDDLNASAVIGTVFDLISQINKVLDAGGENTISRSDAQHLTHALEWIYEGLGVMNPAGDFLERDHKRQLSKNKVDSATVEALLEKRRAARAAKDWAQSDAIRDELAALGVKIKDRPDGSAEWSF